MNAKSIIEGLPYGYWLDPAARLHPVRVPGGHWDVISKLIGEERSIMALEHGWVRVVVEKHQDCIWYEQGNSRSASSTQIKVLRDMAIENNMSLVRDNDNREIYSNTVVRESKPKGRRTAEGLASWKDRYYADGKPDPKRRIRIFTKTGSRQVRG